MNRETDIQPKAVLEALLAKGGRSTRQKNLEKVYEICSRQYEAGSRDFSVATIGRLIEVANVLKARALYNAPSADYRAVIEAWAVYAGPLPPKPIKNLASQEYLVRIEDPALRSIMQAIIAERDKLKAQINVLKANAQVTVDRRPLGATIATTQGMQPTAVIALSAQLTPTERESLEKAISPEHLTECGLREGSYGEIINERGRTLFDVGFARAIRRVLGG